MILELKENVKAAFELQPSISLKEDWRRTRSLEELFNNNFALGHIRDASSHARSRVSRDYSSIAKAAQTTTSFTATTILFQRKLRV